MRNNNGGFLSYCSVCVHLSYHAILALLGSNGLHDVTHKLPWGCQHGGSSVHNGLAALRAPASLLAIDLESASHHTCQKLLFLAVTLGHKIISNLSQRIIGRFMVMKC